MKQQNPKNMCKRIRGWLSRVVTDRIGPESGWAQEHIAGCDRCQRRLATAGRVDLGFSLLKCDVHSAGLLARANSDAIGVLGHGVRNGAKALKLKTAEPKVSLRERIAVYARPILNAAACLVIVGMIKVGMFSSMKAFEDGGQKAYKQYYARGAGEDIAEDIFKV